MKKCEHKNLECINYYDLIRKYRCLNCGGVFICECYKRIGERLLPHQLSFATEYGTKKMIKVDGFELLICENCRGIKEEAHPKAEIWGYSKKFLRYYWHEIHKSTLEAVVDWMDENSIHNMNIVEFRQKHPDILKDIEKEAREKWRILHQENPKYEYKEETEAQFLKRVKIDILKIESEYIQIEKDSKKIGKWINKNGYPVNAEDIAEEYYKELGYEVIRCERGMINIFISCFLYNGIVHSGDPKIQLCSRMSTKGWKMDNRMTGLIFFLKPQDFGTEMYYIRRKDIIDKALIELEEQCSLVDIYDNMYAMSQPLRDYLWVNEDFHYFIGKRALEILPTNVVIKTIKWVIGNFFERHTGWPDFLIFHPEKGYKFIEVKTPNDKLSENQRRWFEWAVSQDDFHCGILRVKKEK